MTADSRIWCDAWGSARTNPVCAAGGQGVTAIGIAVPGVVLRVIEVPGGQPLLEAHEQRAVLLPSD